MTRMPMLARPVLHAAVVTLISAPAVVWLAAYPDSALTMLLSALPLAFALRAEREPELRREPARDSTSPAPVDPLCFHLERARALAKE